MLKNLFFNVIIQKTQEEPRSRILLWILSGPLHSGPFNLYSSLPLSKGDHLITTSVQAGGFSAQEQCHFCWSLFSGPYIYPFPHRFNFSPFFSIFKKSLIFHNTFLYLNTPLQVLTSNSCLSSNPSFYSFFFLHSTLLHFHVNHITCFR